MRGSKKRARSLATAREAVEAAQRALLPYAGKLDGPLRAELEQAEQQWREACAAAERADAASQAAALAGFSRIAEQLGSLRHRAIVERPELAVRDLVSRAAETLPTMENRRQRSAAALDLLAVVVEIDA